MKSLYLIKILVSDLENIYVDAASKKEAVSKALEKIHNYNDNLDKDNINDFTEYNFSYKILSSEKIEKNEFN